MKKKEILALHGTDLEKASIVIDGNTNMPVSVREKEDFQEIAFPGKNTMNTADDILTYMQGLCDVMSAKTGKDKFANAKKKFTELKKTFS